jgi:hypothetical protein
MTTKKDRLNTAVEKSIHRHVQRIKESTVDFVHLYVRRNNIDLDRPTMAKVLEIVSEGLTSEHMNKLDMFMRELDDTLTEFAKETE